MSASSANVAPTVAAAPDDPSPIEAPVPDGVQFVEMSDGQAAAVARMIGLYERAGLEMPPLVIRGSDDGADCGHHEGVHRSRGDWSEVVLCTDGGTGWERRTVAHELAHAWVAHHVTDEQRDEFRELRGWTHWRDYEAAEWRDNGTEQAAEIISWGVYDARTPLLVDVHSCAGLHAAYTSLTGRTAPQTDTALCDPAEVLRM